MDSGRPPFRTRAFRSVSRFLHRSGILALARPFVNSARLHVDQAGHPAFPYIRRRRTRNAQILIYHRVNDDQDPYFRGTPTSEFGRQMEYVSSHFRVLSLHAIVQGLREATLPENAIAVTFDDGYRDNFLNAFPILERYSIPATIFLATSAIGTDRQLWHDDVFSAFRETAVSSLKPIGGKMAGGSLATIADRLHTQQVFLGYIRTLPEAERAEAVAQLRDTLRVGAPREAPGLMLGWEDVGAMSRSGIQFGSHTATHPILSRVDRARAQRELVESKQRIEEQLGVPVEGFAYPNGTRADFLPETKEVLREAGYAYAVTTISGSNEPGQDLYELRRATPWDDDIFAFGLRLHYNKLCS